MLLRFGGMTIGVKDSSTVENEFFMYVKLFILFYADDTVIISESADGLQHALNEFYTYCNQWKLTVNVDKTKVMVFSKGPTPKNVFYFHDNVIESVKEFKYLGIIFSRSGSFCKAKKHLYEQAQKAMYGVIRKIRQFNLPLECQLDLFDKIVVPVLLYGCEIWGFESLDIIERIHLKFLKYIFNLKSSTPTYMMYGETGHFPLYVTVYTRMICYWNKLLLSPENKIVCILYKYLYEKVCKESYQNAWLSCIRNIFNSCGYSNIWNDQMHFFINNKCLKTSVEQRLKDQYIQKWQSDIRESSKGQIYNIFKTEFGPEKYLNLLPKKFRTIFIKFRTANHHLPIETGRWCGTPKLERTCHVCNRGQIGDEYHYILECNVFGLQRKKYLPEKYHCRPNFYKFSELMKTADYNVLTNLCIFISKIYEKVCPP